VASRPDLNSADLLRSSRDVFHHLRKPTDLDEMRKTLQKPVPSTVWPANALARIEGPRSIDCFVSTSSFVIGRFLFSFVLVSLCLTRS
jgi:hypothetical protein